MLPLRHYQERRRQFLSRLPGPAILFAGGLRARATPFSDYPYRADSNFLFFFADPEPGSAAFFDPDDGTVTLFVPERTIATALWEGAVPGHAEVQEAAGVDTVLGTARIAEQAARLANGRPLLSVAVADEHTNVAGREVTGLPLVHADPERVAPPELVDVLADLRVRKSPEEADEIRQAGSVTREAFLRVMGETRPGGTEQELAGTVHGTYVRHGCTSGYGTILTVRGEVLHNLHHRNPLRPGDLVLLDSGAEVRSGYGADVTRTWPAGGRFSDDQRRLYSVVLAAMNASKALVRPGSRWRDVHLAAAHVIAEGLVDEGLLRGNPADLVERGAHALFFPHGVGHFLGLDTHDLRIFGDRILYPGARERSGEFGTDALRMDTDLEAGMVVTVEPGMYFVPAILRMPGLRERFADAADFDRAEEWLGRNEGRGFGGIRLEDDLLVTADGHENLTPGIPLAPDEVESAAGGQAGNRA